MIKTIQDAIITDLTGISSVKTVDVWVGDADEVAASPALLPALYCVYEGMSIGSERVIGGTHADARIHWLVILIARNLRDAADAAETCWDIIEDVRTALMGTTVSTYGRLWPEAENLLSANKGTLIYGLSYYMDITLP